MLLRRFGVEGFSRFGGAEMIVTLAYRANANKLQSLARSGMRELMNTLDSLPVGERARIVSVDWAGLVDEEAERLRALGLDAGARVAIANRGVFGGADPVAVMIGRMTVAVRRVHAAAMQVEAA